MCTAINFKNKSHFFGRTLDNDFSYGEKIVITPRNFPLEFTDGFVNQSHYALLGVAHTENGYPLYYDAVNEKGLCMASLRFAKSSHYFESDTNKTNIASFELIPKILSQCENIGEVYGLLQNAVITKTAFSESLPPSPLHWIAADRNECIVIESEKAGLNIYQNDIGVLTNELPFPFQKFKLNDYMSLTNKTLKNNFSSKLNLEEYSRGMGGIGLPGDLSSSSRFIRGSFFKLNSENISIDNELAQFFHIADTVMQPLGGCITENGGFEKTVYTSCYATDNIACYYTTYENRTIRSVKLHNCDIRCSSLTEYDMYQSMHIVRQN